MGISLKDGQYMRELGHGILPAAVFRCQSQTFQYEERLGEPERETK